MYWFAGSAPAGFGRAAGAARVVEGLSGAAGSLTAVAAAQTVAETAAPAVAVSLPADGTRVALVLSPP